MNEKIFNKAIIHLEKDTKLYNLIEKHGKLDFGKKITPFHSLLKYIIYQQLSIHSAKAIYMRFLQLFNNNPTPNNCIQTSYSDFNNIGISKQKINYIYNISNYFLENPINFNDMSNTEIRNSLIEVKGIGLWTIDMFLIFTLNRLDILPIGDLGIKKGFRILYNLDSMPTDEFMLERAEKWDPYQSIASLYLWKIVDGDVVF